MCSSSYIDTKGDELEPRAKDQLLELKLKMVNCNRRATLQLLKRSSNPFLHSSPNPTLLPSPSPHNSPPLSQFSIFRTCFDQNPIHLQPNIFRSDHKVLSFFNPFINFVKTKQWGVGVQHRCYGSTPGLVQRNPRFSNLNDEDVRYFEGILGAKNVIQDDEKLITANTDWLHKYKGSSKLLLQPRNTDQVSQILKYCNSRCLAVVPQGGNTGLVGGSVPVFDEVYP